MGGLKSICLRDKCEEFQKKEDSDYYRNNIKGY